MKTIKTLRQDIYSVFEDNGPKPSEDAIKAFSESMVKLLTERLTRKDDRQLRVSKLGVPDRKLWYTINQPEIGEPLDSQTKLKFLYGEIVEQLVLFLAQTAGHRIEATQHEVDINGIKGHCDSVIDGVLMDVKSASSFAFKSFDPARKDSFGYVDQLNAYLYGLKDESVLEVKKEAGFLVVNKEDGDIKVVMLKSNGVDYDAKVDDKRKVISLPSPPETKCHDPVANDAKGNMVLHRECSWCPFKKECWKDANNGAGLIALPYAGGPRYFTTIVKTPTLRNPTPF